jgi:mycofactocin system glycosyltransferase
VIVDDGSVPPLPDGLADVRLPASLGPAAARNAARPLLSDLPPGAVVCFLDADTLPPPGFLDGLVGHFSDERVGAVAPRVRVAAGTSAPAWLAAYEERFSPLDLGPDPGVVGTHRRVAYVPSAALVCRKEALDAVGWFDASLRVGEDVDLIRRLEEEGWAVRYDPAVVVEHDPRPGISEFVRQRYGYGRSAAALDVRHPGSVAPLALSPAGAVVAIFAAGAVVGPRRRAPLLLAGLVATLARNGIALESDLRRLGVGTATARREAARLTGRLLAGTAAGSLTAIRRAWLPATLLLGTVAPRRALCVAALAQLTRRPLPGSATQWCLALLDDAAYGAGLWAGCLRARSPGALIPRRLRIRETPTAR